MMTREEFKQRYQVAASKDNVSLAYERQLWQARFSPCGQFLVGCGYDATIQRWQVEDEEFTVMQPLLGHNGWVQAMHFQAGTKCLWSADSWGRIMCWDYAEAAPKIRFEKADAHAGWIRTLSVSPDGKLVATGGNDSAVRIWGADDAKLRFELPHAERVFSVCFHPHTGSLVTGDLRGTIREWNLESRTTVRTLDAGVLFNDETETLGRIQQCGGVRQLTFDSTGKRLACGGQKEPGGGFAKGTPCVLVFDWDSGKLLREMPMGSTQDGFTYDVQFHPEGFVMATSSAFPGKGHVWFWLPDEDEAFFSSKKLPNGRTLSLHPDGRRLAHLTSKSPNGNGRALRDGAYVGGSALIQILRFSESQS